MSEMQTVEAIYKNGVLHPLEAIANLPEHRRVKITIEFDQALPNSLLEFAGILSDEEAAELQEIMAQEFEKVDLSAW